MSAIEQLKEIFLTGAVRNEDGIFSFEGELEKYQNGLEKLENDLGYKVPSEIVEFLFIFGGTKLFVDSSLLSGHLIE
jgi:hypothetical protein